MPNSQGKAMKITDECMSCGSCQDACPVNAISEGDEHYMIDPQVCVVCEGHYDSSQCVDVCPADAIVEITV